jgi:hypothetical protein
MANLIAFAIEWRFNIIHTVGRRAVQGRGVNYLGGDDYGSPLQVEVQFGRIWCSRRVIINPSP